jgi:DNA-binding beta-propeller fold protein YncE
MRGSRAARRQGTVRLMCLGLVAALSGGTVLGLSARPAGAQDELFVANPVADSITVYGRTASDDVAPLRSISGTATGLAGPGGIAVDPANDEVLVANARGHSITVYGRAASGNISALRTIRGAATGLSSPSSLAVDTVNDEVLVTNVLRANGLPGQPATPRGSITVYGRTASGNVAPLRTIRGAGTGLTAPFGIAIDTANDEVLVANVDSITVYRRTATGYVAPRRTIKGTATGLSRPAGIAVDTLNDEVLVANQGGDSIAVFSRTARGNVAPLRTISGGATGLSRPTGVAVDFVNDEILVANQRADSVTVYGRTASGDVAPLRAIRGAATGLSSPVFPAITVIAEGPCPSAFDLDFGGTEYAECFRDLLTADGINAGPDVGGTGHTSLNFTGTTTPTNSTWLTVYDATPSTPSAGPTFDAQTLCADVLIERFDNVKGAGVVALLNEAAGSRGLALLIQNAGNTDTLLLATVEGQVSKRGKLAPLLSISLAGGIAEKQWYRLVLTADPATPAVTGKVFRHSVATDPNSALGTQVGTTLMYRPPALPAGVTSPGASAIIAAGVNAVVNSSVTNLSNDATQCGQ